MRLFIVGGFRYFCLADCCDLGCFEVTMLRPFDTIRCEELIRKRYCKNNFKKSLQDIYPQGLAESIQLGRQMSGKDPPGQTCRDPCSEGIIL